MPDLNLTTLISSILSSVGVTAVGAWWLGKRWVDHRLNTELEKTKGNIRKEIENELADTNANRQYQLAAKTRLYSAIGPLKFQLLIACRDLALHIRAFGLEGISYSLSPTNYYGQSTLYRILQPLVISELIEKQIAVTDFSVDKEAVDLLVFKKLGYEALKGDKPILNNPDEDWNHQTQHLFHHSISKIVSSLIVVDGTLNRPMHFKEFEQFLLSVHGKEVLGPLVDLIQDFTIMGKPILWVRLVFYAYCCSHIVNKLGIKIGFSEIDIHVRELLLESNNEFNRRMLEDFQHVFSTLINGGL
ncbi:hypothetical protein [Sulfurirhabdus autotrophica]|uniref:Uncharacterized protein n=1 Tax=Sulfurirhabdus autotrophica TaxID=1706046 RepID=A0A4R3XWV7_9PROT|nr:hypothetical protein [Sulfurirhabdus autotrophica]TCV81259.1 hypothetical protein EDC63_1247 [Sulfurirhabdus autotrophica]